MAREYSVKKDKKSVNLSFEGTAVSTSAYYISVQLIQTGCTGAFVGQNCEICYLHNILMLLLMLSMLMLQLHSTTSYKHCSKTVTYFYLVSSRNTNPDFHFT